MKMVMMEPGGMLRGHRPAVLTVSNNSRNIKKKKKQQVHGHGSEPEPVIVYLKSPRVIHVRPEEFMGLVQQLTGNRSSSSSSSLSVSSADHISLSFNSSSIQDSTLRLPPPTIPSTS
ncbi:hypothetical protein L6164_033970 [Bauhinia variegata]|uniref:Uncharacterized protein n=1 Tax=Bauhinia variegata TaxID=167791 RepID=A0ACB9KTH1_BAUVA|nr:hypothetical protein L6164_033970 [Bauhinia variegata]